MTESKTLFEGVSGMPGKREIVNVNKHSKLWWLLPTCLGAAAVGVYAGFCVAASMSESIAPNTVIAGQDVGGMTRLEAVRALEPVLEKLGGQCGVHVTLNQQEEIAYLSYNDLGVSFDAASLAEEAYESSHSGNALADGWNLICTSLGKSKAVSAEPGSGWETEAAGRLAEAADLEPQDFTYEVADEDTLLLTKAKDGRSTDRAALAARLGSAGTDASGSRTVDLPYTTVAADQGDLNAMQESLGGVMANASYDAATGTIIPEKAALLFDVVQAQKLLDAAAPGTQVSVPAEAAEPSVTAEELQKVLFRDVLGTYTTRVGGAAGRKSNVKLTAKRVNGTVLNSGEEFNYYKLTGPFSASNGYQSAPGYLNGKTVEMDGGGACQCSSTTYAAALLANLEIVARTAHGFASDYIGLGMDATVSGGGPDFIFRNNTAYPIRIDAEYSDSSRLTVTIRGTKTDDTTVKMRTEVLSTTPYEEQIVETTELAPGQRKVDQTPYTGYSVNTYRQLYDGSGNLISETFEASSRYKKRDRIVLVGAGAAAGETAEGGADTPAETPEGSGSTAEPDANAANPDTGSAPAPDSGGTSGAETELPAFLDFPQSQAQPELPPEIPGGISPTPIDQQIDQLAGGGAV